MKRALVLFAHGSRDPEWARPIETLAGQLRLRLPDVAIATAYLELMKPGLDEAVEKLIEGGAADITIVPLFLAQGSHLRRDLPAMVEALRAAWPTHSINVTRAIGEMPEVLSAIAGCIAGIAES